MTITGGANAVGIFQGNNQMTPHLTTPNSDFDDMAPTGMMFWSGTCSDPVATCEGCRHYGFETAIRNRSGNVVSTREYSTRCALYHKHTREIGDSLHRTTPACKYFEAKTS
jgi:hypothetical protein